MESKGALRVSLDLAFGWWTLDSLDLGLTKCVEMWCPILSKDVSTSAHFKLGQWNAKRIPDPNFSLGKPQPHLCLLTPIWLTKTRLRKKLEEQFSKKNITSTFTNPVLSWIKLLEAPRPVTPKKTSNPLMFRDMLGLVFCDFEIIFLNMKNQCNWTVWSCMNLSCSYKWTPSFLLLRYDFLQPLFFQHMWEEQQLPTEWIRKGGTSRALPKHSKMVGHDKMTELGSQNVSIKKEPETLRPAYPIKSLIPMLPIV